MFSYDGSSAAPAIGKNVGTFVGTRDYISPEMV